MKKKIVFPVRIASDRTITKIKRERKKGASMIALAKKYRVGYHDVRAIEKGNYMRKKVEDCQRWLEQKGFGGKEKMVYKRLKKRRERLLDWLYALQLYYNEFNFIKRIQQKKKIKIVKAKLNENKKALRYFYNN